MFCIICYLFVFFIFLLAFILLFIFIVCLLCCFVSFLPFSSPKQWPQAPVGRFLKKNPKKQSLRIQECHFLKIALNLDLTLPDYRSRRELSGSILKIENGALGVELWPFY